VVQKQGSLQTEKTYGEDVGNCKGPITGLAEDTIATNEGYSTTFSAAARHDGRKQDEDRENFIVNHIEETGR